MRDLWNWWRARRSETKQGKAFLALPHDKNDPECVMWNADARPVDWHARCPSCNPQPVHYMSNGGALHAFVDPLSPENGSWTTEPEKVTCAICVSVLGTEASA